MSPGTATLLSGLVSSAGQLYANQQNLAQSNKWNSEQIDLANTAHQREILDLAAAGLNPVLSASSSGSAVPQLSGADIANPGEGVSRGISSAARLRALEVPAAQAKINVDTATAENLKVQNDNLKAQTDLIHAQTELYKKGDPETWVDKAYDTARRWHEAGLDNLENSPLNPSLNSAGEFLRQSFGVGGSDGSVPDDIKVFDPNSGRYVNPYAFPHRDLIRVDEKTGKIYIIKKGK